MLERQMSTVGPHVPHLEPLNHLSRAALGPLSSQLKATGQKQGLSHPGPAGQNSAIEIGGFFGKKDLLS